MGGAARCLLLCPWAERQASCTIGDDRFVPNTDSRQALLSHERLRKYTLVPYRNPACIKLFARATIRRMHTLEKRNSPVTVVPWDAV
jgi:hypothetical protein